MCLWQLESKTLAETLDDEEPVETMEMCGISLITCSASLKCLELALIKAESKEFKDAEAARLSHVNVNEVDVPEALHELNVWVDTILLEDMVRPRTKVVCSCSVCSLYMTGRPRPKDLQRRV